MRGIGALFTRLSVPNLRVKPKAVHVFFEAVLALVIVFHICNRMLQTGLVLLERLPDVGLTFHVGASGKGRQNRSLRLPCV